MGSWGGQVELRALGNALHVHIPIFSVASHLAYHVLDGHHADGAAANILSATLLYGDRHYDLVYRSPDE